MKSDISSFQKNLRSVSETHSAIKLNHKFNFPFTRATKPEHSPVSTGLAFNISLVEKLPVEIVEVPSQGVCCMKASEPGTS